MVTVFECSVCGSQLYFSLEIILIQLIPWSSRVTVRSIFAEHEIATTEDSADGMLAGFSNLGLGVIGEREKRVKNDQQRTVLP